MDQNCTTTQYAGTGCIGTATSTHGTLPFTGLDVLGFLALGLVIAMCGVAGWLHARHFNRG